MRQRAYPTDASDAEWAAAVSMIPVPAWMGGPGGRPEGCCHREMIDAVRYVVDNGIKWALPKDFLCSTVFGIFTRWCEQGVLFPGL